MYMPWPTVWTATTTFLTQGTRSSHARMDTLFPTGPPGKGCVNVTADYRGYPGGRKMVVGAPAAGGATPARPARFSGRARFFELELGSPSRLPRRQPTRFPWR